MKNNKCPQCDNELERDQFDNIWCEVCGWSIEELRKFQKQPKEMINMEVRYFKIPEEIKELNEWCKGVHTWHDDGKNGVVCANRELKI